MNAYWNDIRSSFNRRWEDWLNRRIPQSNQFELKQKEIFIFPTRWGLLFALLIVLTLITGINYQNAMIMATGFLLMAIYLLHLLQTYQMLSGLHVGLSRIENCFAGQQASISFEVGGNGRRRPVVEMGWLPNFYERVSVPAEGRRKVTVYLATVSRGHLRPGRLLVTSAWPLGWVRAWSWLSFPTDCWVYPEPLEGELRLGLQADSDQRVPPGPLQRHSDPEEFSGLREHRQGEGISRIVWKRYAQTGQKLVRDFSEPQRSPVWVDYFAYTGHPLERRLSLMCYRIVDLSRQGKPVGLKLPGTTLDPAVGERHTRECLEQLAAFDNAEARLEASATDG